MILQNIQLKDLILYENNPRDNSNAIAEVKKSIEQCGYITPIIIDENNIILAGHTRYQALSELGINEVECIILTNLTEEQKMKFRLLDNRLNEISQWDLEMLKEELKDLDLGDFDGFDYLTEQDKNELSNIPMDDVFENEEHIVVKCPRCGAVVEEADVQ